MIPLRNKSNFFTEYLTGLRNEPYLKINLVFAGVILLLFIYSGIYSSDKNNYPVVCIHEKVTGEKCFSCGISHSFSLILRGRIDEAYQRNQYGMAVFLFFLSQLFMRILFSFYYFADKDHRKQLVLYDILGSILIFLITFYPFFRQLFISLFSR